MRWNASRELASVGAVTRSRSFRVAAAGLAAGILALLFCEASLLVYVYAVRSPMERFDWSAGTFTLRPGTYPNRPDPRVVNSRGFVGGEFEDPRPRGTLRIAALGDSCTFGMGSLTGHYPAKLQERLNRSGEWPPVQVINASVEGMNTSMMLRRLRTRVLPLDPDIVSVYAGWNDLMKFNPEGVSDAPGLSGFWRYADRTWTVRGLRKLVYYYGRRDWVEPAVGEMSRTGRFRDYRPAVFEATLAALVRTGRDAGARVVLMTLPSPLRLDLDAEDLRRARIQFPYFRDGANVGDFTDLVAGYNRAIRRVSVAEGALLVDLDRDIPMTARTRAFFFDAMHATQAGHAVIADLLEAALLAAGPPAPSSSAPSGGEAG